MPRRKSATTRATDPFSAALRPMVRAEVRAALAELALEFARKLGAEVPTESAAGTDKPEHPTPAKGSNGTKKHGTQAPSSAE